MYNYFTKKKSKKGLTLVEVICAIFVLSIIFVGILNAVAFSRQMVFTNNSREKASFKAQLVADEIFATAAGKDPDSVEASALADTINAVLNNEEDPQNIDEENMAAVGTVRYAGEGEESLSDPSDFVDDGDCYVEYSIDPVKSSEVYENEGDEGLGKYNEVAQRGWNIKVRVFYREIGSNSDFRVVDLSIFAPFNSIK